ncbi:MAG: hypothetical protein FWG91_00235 [Lachnospiraceae bacterium]|nr:hypothetical protein [Lachnospiraceae bacterium]
MARKNSLYKNHMSIAKRNEDDSLGKLFEQIKECLQLGYAIEERTFSDVSRIIIERITSNSKSDLPESFQSLVDYVEDYCFYEIESEKDYQRVMTFSRFRQIFKMFKLFGAMRTEKEEIEKDARKYESYCKILNQIKSSYGITKTDLIKRGLRIEELVEKGYLIDQRVVGEIYYHLSSTGLCLLDKINVTGSGMGSSSNDLEDKLYSFQMKGNLKEGYEVQNQTLKNEPIKKDSLELTNNLQCPIEELKNLNINTEIISKYGNICQRKKQSQAFENPNTPKARASKKWQLIEYKERGKKNGSDDFNREYKIGQLNL